MRENRTYGSEGGEAGRPVFPTPIPSSKPSDQLSDQLQAALC
jgi:hypothetical protein